MKSSDQRTSQNAADPSSNFHVCVRMRPTSSPSYDNSGVIAGTKYIRAGPESSILLVQPNSTQEDKVFIYDEVFDSKTSTRDIFEKVVKPNLADSLFKGFSHTVLVYGMTGSGKTFTMFGANGEAAAAAGSSAQTSLPQAVVPQQRDSLNQDVDNNEIDGPLRKSQNEPPVVEDCPIETKGGIVSMTVKMVLQRSEQSNAKTKVRMSYLEIYNESIRDLLSNEVSTSENLMILEDPDRGVYCPLLSEKDISSIEQINQLIKQGNRRRVMASTKLNEFSSRSHAIIQLSMEIEVESNERVTTFLTPKLYLVDLAGSERASATESKGVRLKEGANINKSLLSLGNCITVLSQAGKKQHVPYRDSKLTRLLKESLGGNAKTLLIACVTPAYRFVEETINTLKYAQRAKSIHKDVYENVKQIYNKIEQTQAAAALAAEAAAAEAAAVLAQHQLDEQRESLRQSNNASEMFCTVSILDADIPDEEKVKRLGNRAVNENEINGSTSFKTHRETFQEQFKSLSDQFEDVLLRIQELEANIQEHKQSRDQNEKLVHEIMDTINPSALSQKEMKSRVDKVNLLRSVIKSSEEAMEKLERELFSSEHMKESIKAQLIQLYELKFVQECMQLTNFQLYNSFELEKKRLREQITQLIGEQKIQNEEEVKRDRQIMRLQEEIQYMKMKADQTQALLDSQNQLNRQNNHRNKSKRNLNLRNSMYQPTTKATPRNGSLAAQQPVQSKYMQMQTFVPSSNISATVIRDRSCQNMRASMYALNRVSEKAPDQNNNSSSSNANVFSDSNKFFGAKTMTEFVRTENSPQQQQQQRSEYEEFKRKERIIETQLGPKNLRASRVISEANSSAASSSTVPVATVTATAAPTMSSGQASSQTSMKKSTLFKSSFKQSFIDLAHDTAVGSGVISTPERLSLQPNNNGTSNNNTSNMIGQVLFSSYQDTNSNDNSSDNLSHYNLQWQQQKSRESDFEVVKRSSFNLESKPSQKSSYSPGQFSKQSQQSQQFSSPKSVNKAKQTSLFQQQGNQSGGSYCPSTTSKSPSQISSDERNSNSSSYRGISLKDNNYSPVIQSQFDLTGGKNFNVSSNQNTNSSNNNFHLSSDIQTNTATAKNTAISSTATTTNQPTMVAQVDLSSQQKGQQLIPNKVIPKPSFNSYAQNNAMYGVVASGNADGAVKMNLQSSTYVPTTAIQLNLTKK